MIVDGYVRVSRVDKRRGKRFISPAVQRDQIERWARGRGALIDQVFEELDESGGRADRPLLLEAIRRVEEGESDGVVVAYMSRFGRSTLDGLLAIKRIADAGGSFVSVQDGMDYGSDTGRFVLRHMLSVAEWDLDRIRDQWRVASERAVARGLYIGPAPFGYKRGKDGRLRAHQREGPVVTELFRRRAEGAQFVELTRWLRQCGVPPQITDTWHRGAAKDMIRKRLYLGESKHGDAINPTAHTALVDPATWQRAQFFGLRTPRAPQEPVLLWGLVRCGSCQRLLTSQTARPGGSDSTRTYHCNGRNTRTKCPHGVHLRDRAIEPYIEAIFWQEADKISQARKPIRLTRLQQTLERRAAELSAYRDNPRLPVVLGERRFGDGVTVRARRVELAELELARARRSARPAALAPAAELRQRWTSMSIPERRSAISEVIDCVFVMPAGDHAMEPRIHVLLRGRGPVGLPTMGEKCAAHPPFDRSAFPTRVRLRPLPDWDLTRLRTELDAFTHGEERWPNFQEFQAAGRALLHAQAERHYGVQWWARALGVPFVVRAADRDTWTDEKIRAGLSIVLAGRTHWPTWHEFKRSGHNRLRQAIAVTGGAERWAAEFGVHLPKNARAIHRTWSYTSMKAEVARLAGPDKRYPSHAVFRVAGLHGLCDVIARRGVRDQIAAELGLTIPNPRTPRHRRWTPELIRAELDEFLRGRDEWPRTPEFVAAGLAGLRQVMHRDGTIHYWAAQYGMTVRRNKQNR